ncbi:MAG TPA: hypothetical protein PKM78_00210 [Anaerolineae bacterium]|nr:hypothetical protein [Anaerolineae bacterium]HNU03775.1 hypothetical protein [Anaerolineae bacterium]
MTGDRLKSLGRQHGVYLAALLAVTAAMFFLWGNVNWHIPPADRWDGWHYRTMAEAAPGLSQVAAAPFRYRVLGTYTIGLLFGANSIAGFFVVNYAALLAVVLLLYFFLCAVGISRPVAAFSTALFTMNTHLFGLTAWLTFHTNDSLAMLFLLLALWATMKRRWGLFSLALLLGALSRETWVLAAPTALVFLWERKLLRSDLGKMLLALLPAVIATLLLRTLLRADVVGSLEPLQAFLRFAPKAVDPEFWARQFANALKPLSFLPLIFLGITLRWARGNLFMVALILLTFLSSLLGSANERLMAPAFVAFYWLLALIIQEGIWPHRVMLAILAAATFLSTLHYWYARFPLPSRQLTIAIGGAAWVVVTAAAIIFRLRTRRAATGEIPGKI